MSILLLLATCLVACNRDQLDMNKSGSITTSERFGIANLTVLHVDPNGRTVEVDWKAYNVISGHAFRVPYETIRLSSGDEVYEVSDETAGNNELTVNGVTYNFESRSEQIRITFGEGVAIEPGGGYKSAIQCRDFAR